MKCLKKLTLYLIVFCIITSTFTFIGYSLTAQNSISSNDFLQMAGELVNNYDTPFYLPESSTEVVFGESNRLIIKTTTNDALTDDRGAVAKVEGWNSMHILQYSSKEEAKEALDFYLTQAFVDYVEEDQYVEFFPESNSDEIVSEKPLSWGNYAIKSSSINEALIKSNIDLSEVVVGIFDTGLNTEHDYFSEDRILEGYNVFDQNTNITDRKGHGSRVAGIVYNNTLSNVKIKMYKLNSSTFISNTVAVSLFASSIISAVDEGVDVINMSLSLNVKSNYIDDAIEYAYNNNVPVVVAAGNDYDGDGKNADNLYLASKETVLTVAAVDKNLTPMLKSNNGDVSTNYGSCIDISAPGENINTVNFLLGYMEDSGTSMAAPFVTAAAATLKSIKQSLSTSEIFNIIKTSAFAPAGWNSDKYGTGIVNYENMLSNLITSMPKISLGSNNATIIPPSKNAIIYYTTDGTEPLVGISSIYTEPINTNGISVIKAIAIENGKMPSGIASRKLWRQEKFTLRYKATEKLPVYPDEKIGACYVANKDIVTYEGDGKIKAHSIGETQVVAFLENNCSVTYSVSVEYTWWQWVIRIFLLGFLWY